MLFRQCVLLVSLWLLGHLCHARRTKMWERKTSVLMGETGNAAEVASANGERPSAEHVHLQWRTLSSTNSTQKSSFQSSLLALSSKMKARSYSHGGVAIGLGVTIVVFIVLVAGRTLQARTAYRSRQLLLGAERLPADGETLPGVGVNRSNEGWNGYAGTTSPVGGNRSKIDKGRSVTWADNAPSEDHTVTEVAGDASSERPRSRTVASQTNTAESSTDGTERSGADTETESYPPEVTQSASIAAAPEGTVGATLSVMGNTLSGWYIDGQPQDAQATNTSHVVVNSDSTVVHSMTDAASASQNAKPMQSTLSEWWDDVGKRPSDGFTGVRSEPMGVALSGEHQNAPLTVQSRYL